MISLRPDVAQVFTPESLAEIQGISGPFYIRSTGYHPEAGFCYFYGDDKYQFFFYTVAKSGRGGGILDTNDATTGRFSGRLPEIERSDVQKIERNITKLFQERDAGLPKEPVLEKNIPEKIAFSWRLGQ